MKVFISGAGIAGLFAATKLASAGINVIIIERATEFVPRGHALVIYANGMAMLDSLGVGVELRGKGIRLETYTIADATGARRRHLDFSEATSGFGEVLQIHRFVLHQALFARAINAGVLVRFAKTLRDIRVTGDSYELLLSDGIKEKADVVIGADGFGSSVRGLYFPEARVVKAGVRGWSFRTDRYNPRAGIVEFLGKGRCFGFYPTSNAETSVFCGALDKASPQTTVSPHETLRSLFADFNSQAQRAVSDLDPMQIYSHDMETLSAPKWVRGRVVLIGDSAHGMVPYSGMGASLAMEDAFDLTNTLIEHSSNQQLDEELLNFEARRKERIRFMGVIASGICNMTYRWKLPFWLKACLRITPLCTPIFGASTLQELVVARFYRGTPRVDPTREL